MGEISSAVMRWETSSRVLESNMQFADENGTLRLACVSMTAQPPSPPSSSSSFTIIRPGLQHGIAVARSIASNRPLFIAGYTF